MDILYPEGIENKEPVIFFNQEQEQLSQIMSDKQIAWGSIVLKLMAPDHSNRMTVQQALKELEAAR